MSIFDLFDAGACHLAGRKNVLFAWTWEEYRKQKALFKDRLVLVDMIGHPVSDSVEISDDLFSGKYREGTLFALYCHSGGSSGHL